MASIPKVEASPAFLKQTVDYVETKLAEIEAAAAKLDANDANFPASLVAVSNAFDDLLHPDRHDLDFVVQIVSGTNLRAMDLNGKSDPYVEIWYSEDLESRDLSKMQICLNIEDWRKPDTFNGSHTRESLEKAKANEESNHGVKQVFVTDVKQKTLNPVWDRQEWKNSFKPKSVGGPSHTGMQFRVFDHDKFSKNDFIGMALLPQDLDFYADGERHELDLQLKEQKMGDTGLLKVAITVSKPKTGLRSVDITTTNSDHQHSMNEIQRAAIQGLVKDFRESFPQIKEHLKRPVF